MNEHVLTSCCELTLPISEVLKEVKVCRKKALDQKTAGFEMGMKECPNCKLKGLFVHDGNKAKCVHPDHDRICEDQHKRAAEEAAAAARIARTPRETKCKTCGCTAMIRPGQFRPAEEAEEPPSRCARHVCLSASNMEIACGGQCDGCMQVTCSRCDRCRCYKSNYSFRRCDSCNKFHELKPAKYPLSPAFPPRSTDLLLCNICDKLEKKRSRDAEEERKRIRNESAYKGMGFGGRRQEEKISRHLRKWRAECIRDNLEPNSKEASQRLTVAKGCAGFYGNQAAWKYLSKKFFQRKKESQREYLEENLEEYINIPLKYQTY